MCCSDSPTTVNFSSIRTLRYSVTMSSVIGKYFKQTTWPCYAKVQKPYGHFAWGSHLQNTVSVKIHGLRTEIHCKSYQSLSHMHEFNTGCTSRKPHIQLWQEQSLIVREAKFPEVDIPHLAREVRWRAIWWTELEAGSGNKLSCVSHPDLTEPSITPTLWAVCKTLDVDCASVLHW